MTEELMERLREVMEELGSINEELQEVPGTDNLSALINDMFNEADRFLD